MAEILCAIVVLRPGWIPKSVGRMAHAVAALRRMGGCDFAILDPGLPDSDFDKSLERIPLLKHFGARRVFVVTGAEVTPELAEKCRGYGADGAISKDCHGLTEALCDALDVAANQQEPYNAGEEDARIAGLGDAHGQ
jgi:DNA-binding NarL/FixJ family response regulator